ncbi:MAG: HAD family hydrolase, partial [Eggerthella lenta]
AKGKTTGAIAKLVDLAPKEAVRLADGVEERVPVEAVRVGDVLAVRAGEGVPVDGTLLEGSGTLDESVITGESVPVDKRPGDRVTGATLNSTGWFTMRADRVGDDTALAGIIRLVDGPPPRRLPSRRSPTRYRACSCRGNRHRRGHVRRVDARRRDAGGRAVARHQRAGHRARARSAWPRPAIMVGTERGATNGILIKSAEALETAHDVKTVVFDKTGTVTEGAPSVTDVLAAPGASEERLLELAVSVEGRSEHPLARAVCAYAREPLPTAARGGLQAGAGEGVAALVDDPPAHAPATCA